MKQETTRDGPVELGDRVWYNSYAPGVPRSIRFEDITPPEVLTRTAGKFPKRTALLFMGKKISYADLERSVSRFANALLALGVRQADKVALLLPNIPNIVVAYYGTWRMGAVPETKRPENPPPTGTKAQTSVFERQ